MHREETVKIGFGSICIGIHCQDQELMERMLLKYGAFLVSHEPDFWIRLNLRNRLTVPEIKSLFTIWRSFLDGNRFFTKPELLECRLDWAEATLWVDTERELFAPEVEYPLMNPLMRGIYAGIHARLRNAKPDAYLVHGCGIVDGRKCYLFTGPSGSGKTTLARLAGGRNVLNDEAVLIGRDREGFHLGATPFDGGITDRWNISGHLSAVFFLKHDTRVSVRKLSKVETYQRFLAQVFDTSPLFEAPGSDDLQERADVSAEVATWVPSYELGFRPDTSFWPVVGNI